jgi:hypothetical protein
MNITALICPACKGTSFIEKGHEGKILVHCASCQSAARIEKAGITQIKDNTNDIENAIYPVAKVIKEKKDKKSETVEIFEEITFSFPKSVKALVQAALWCGKCQRNVTGKWFAGTVLGDIMADYLSGFDYRTLAPADYQRVEDLLKEAAEAVTDEQKKELNLIQEEDRRTFHEIQLQKIATEVVPQFDKIHSEKVLETEKLASEGKEKQVIALQRGRCLDRLSRGIQHLESRLKEQDLPEEKREEFSEHLEIAKEFYASLEINSISPFDEDLKTIFATIEIPKKVYVRSKSGALVDSETGAVEEDNFATLNELETEEDTDQTQDAQEASEASPAIEEENIKPEKKPRKKKTDKIEEKPEPVLEPFWQDMITKNNIIQMKLEQQYKLRGDEKTRYDIERSVFLSEAIKAGTIKKAKATSIIKDLQTISAE